MSAGLICIATDIPGSKEVIRNGENGFLVEPSDRGVCEGLEKALGMDEPRRKSISDHARATVKDLLGPLLNGEREAPAKRFSQPAFFVPENKPISKLLREFQQQKVQIAIVVDEYGGVSGLCTTEDLLEEIVGEIQENYEADEAPFRLLEPGVVEALGRASADDVAEALGVLLQKGSYDSVAGWIITALGAIPKTGERAKVEGLEVEVLSADKKRVHRVRVARPSRPSETSSAP